MLLTRNRCGDVDGTVVRFERPARRWPLSPPRTNATAQASGAMRALQFAMAAFESAELCGADDDVVLANADEVIHRRLMLYEMLARLGLRAAGECGGQLRRDAELLRYLAPPETFVRPATRPA